jgi:hypothetical protein
MTAGTDAKLRSTQKKTVQTRLASNGERHREYTKSVTAGRKKGASSKGASLRDRIVALLEANDPNEMQPKMIATRLRVSRGAVKHAIQRELDSGHPRIVTAQVGGWYRVARNIDRIKALGAATRIELHGIKLEGMCHPTNAGHSISSSSSHKYRKRGIFKETFEGRVVTIIVHEMNLVEVFLETSKVPMDFPMFGNFCFWLYGKMDGIVLDSAWKIVELGINADAHNLMLDGLKRISLKAWKNAWMQIYAKEKDVVRFETHIMPDMQLADCLSVMGQFVDWVEKVQRQAPTQPEEKYIPKGAGDYDPSFA